MTKKNKISKNWILKNFVPQKLWVIEQL